jgi:hypothetical protein
VAHAAGGRPVPRWFNEGLALAAGREWELGDRARVALAVLTGDRLPLARLDREFSGNEREVHAAYALAGDVVRELLTEHRSARRLARVAAGDRFADAFRSRPVSTSPDLSDYWRRRTLWDRWIPAIRARSRSGADRAAAIAAFAGATRDAERLRTGARKRRGRCCRVM